MPLTHTRTFRIRQYECDAHGHVNAANYLRYMQETAFDASAAAGYDQPRYSRMNRIWLIRETGIDYKLPLQYGDSVKINTWVEDFRRVSSRRRYEFLHCESGDLVARAYTDWAFMDTHTERPVLIPQEMAEAFYPKDLPETFPRRQPFPKPPPPPEGILKLVMQVTWQDIDALQHVNNAVYAEYMHECILRLMAENGWPWNRMAQEGFGIYARGIQIKYIQPALLDDKLEITTWAYNMKRSTGVRYYEIHRTSDNALIAQIHTPAVWVDIETGRPIRIPPDFLESFKFNLVD